jgi:hypothetical protein
MKSQSWDYLGHRVELHVTEREGNRTVEPQATKGEDRPAPELFIDGQLVAVERLFDGTYFLPENAYNWSDDLGKLAEELVEYRARVQKIDVRAGAQEQAPSSDKGGRHGPS